MPPAPPAAIAHQAARTPPPARMLVFADEYHLKPSRRVVPAGRLVVQLANIGEDDHNLAVRAANGHILAITRDTWPDAVSTLRVRLKPGRYWLVCTIPGHEGHGMVTPFTMRRAR